MANLGENGAVNKILRVICARISEMKLPNLAL